MKVKMELLSDAIFGNGISIPGGEDRTVLLDHYGFPYYKGGTMKGIFREELDRYLHWTMEGEQRENIIQKKIADLLGETGDSDVIQDGKLVFSDFTLSAHVKEMMLREIREEKEKSQGGNGQIQDEKEKIREENGQIQGVKEEIRDALTHLRTFTRIEDTGIAARKSLRTYRCVNRGLYFYSDVTCREEDKELVREVFSLIKWIGTMRNRGFGNVRITVEEGGDGR